MIRTTALHAPLFEACAFRLANAAEVKEAPLVNERQHARLTENKARDIGAGGF